ncbi:MAG: hypothetical protein WCO56_17480 [Verrucomicrobiota bacterium]
MRKVATVFCAAGQAKVEREHVCIQSGICMDVALRTPKYVKELVTHHVSSRLKVVPKHVNPKVLQRMRFGSLSRQ